MSKHGKGTAYTREDIILLECAATSGSIVEFRDACDKVGRSEKAVKEYLRKHGIRLIAQRSWSSTELCKGRTLIGMQEETGFNRATIRRAIKDLRLRPKKVGRKFVINDNQKELILDHILKKENSWGYSRSGGKITRWDSCTSCGSTDYAPTEDRRYSGNGGAHRAYGLCCDCYTRAWRRLCEKGIENPTPDQFQHFAVHEPSYYVQCYACDLGITRRYWGSFGNRYHPHWVCQPCRQRVVRLLRRKAFKDLLREQFPDREKATLSDLRPDTVLHLAKIMDGGTEANLVDIAIGGICDTDHH